MSISFIWDLGWETIPTDQIPRGDVRNHIGQIKVGTRERMEVEHEWGPNSIIDNGSHIRGGTGVASRGASVPATNLRSGELCVVDTVGGDIQVWLYGDIGAGVKWNLVGTLDHGALLNRNVGDPHPLYVLLSGENISPTPLQMGAKILRMSAGAGTPNRTFGGFLLLDHAYKPHTTVGNLAAIAAGAISMAKIPNSLNVTSGSLALNNTFTYSLPGKLVLFPEIVVKPNSGADTALVQFQAPSSGTPGVQIRNISTVGGGDGSISYQIRVRTIP